MRERFLFEEIAIITIQVAYCAPRFGQDVKGVYSFLGFLFDSSLLSLSPVTCLEQTQILRPLNRFIAAVYIEFAENMLGVRADRGYSHIHLVRDFSRHQIRSQKS